MGIAMWINTYLWKRKSISVMLIVLVIVLTDFTWILFTVVILFACIPYIFMWSCGVENFITLKRNSNSAAIFTISQETFIIGQYSIQINFMYEILLIFTFSLRFLIEYNFKVIYAMIKEYIDKKWCYDYCRILFSFTLDINYHYSHNDIKKIQTLLKMTKNNQRQSNWSMLYWAMFYRKSLMVRRLIYHFLSHYENNNHIKILHACKHNGITFLWNNVEHCWHWFLISRYYSSQSRLLFTS